MSRKNESTTYVFKNIEDFAVWVKQQNEEIEKGNIKATSFINTEVEKKGLCTFFRNISLGNLLQKNEKRIKDDARQASVIEELLTDCLGRIKKCNENIEENNRKIHDVLSQKLQTVLVAMSDASDRIKINIDDALNVDQNKRIMQFQEIVLKQYEAQNEIRKTLNDVLDAYKLLSVENDKLKEQISAYEANIEMISKNCLE